MHKHYRIDLFGGLRLRTDDGVIDRFPTQRAAALLAYLACNDRPLHRREVATAIWDTTEESALVSLRTALSSLRSAVESEPTPSLFLADRFTIRLNPETCSTDVLEFESALLAADRNSESASQHLQTAFDLYRGDFAAGLNEDPIPAKRERFRNSYQRTTARLAESIKDSDPARARSILVHAIDVSGPSPELQSQLVALSKEPSRRVKTDGTPALIDRNPSQSRRAETEERSRWWREPGRVVLMVPALLAAIWLAVTFTRPPVRATGQAAAPARARSAQTNTTPTDGPSRHFAVIDFGLAGGFESELKDIDNHGLAVGSALDSGGIRRAASINRGEIEVLKYFMGDSNLEATATAGTNSIIVNPHISRPGPPGVAMWTDGNGADRPENRNGNGVFINAENIHGRKVGYEQGPASRRIPVEVRGREILRIGPPGVSAEVKDINEQNWAAGIETGASGTRAVMWELGDTTTDVSRRTAVPLPTLGGALSGAIGVNDRGDMAGYAARKGNKAALPVLWRDGKIHTLDISNGSSGIAFEINHDREVAGTISDGRADYAAYWDSEGRFHDLTKSLVNGEGWSLERALSINDLGWICGVGRRDGVRRGFVLLPVDKSEFNASSRPIRTGDQEPGWGWVTLREPAREHLEFHLTATRPEVAEPTQKLIVIPQGTRTAVFFITGKEHTEPQSGAIQAIIGSVEYSASVTVHP